MARLLSQITTVESRYVQDTPFMWPGPGRANLAVANTSTSTVGVLRGNANGAFQVRVAYPGGSRPFGVAAFVAHS